MTETFKARCPRCGATLITNGNRVWCTFIGGGSEKACVFGIDAPVSELSFPATEAELDEIEQALVGNI